MPVNPAILVVTHPRSGTHLTIDLLRRNFPALASRKRRLEALDALYVPIDVVLQADPRQRRRVQRLAHRHAYPILKSHWLNPDFRNLTEASEEWGRWVSEKAKIIYVVRDPKRVLASHYLFEKSYLDIRDDRQRWFDNACRYWSRHVHGWTGVSPDVIVQFEQIIAEPSKTVREFGELLGLRVQEADPILPPKLSSKWMGRWYRVMSSSAPSTEILTPGQGASFDDLFSDLDMTAFRNVVVPTAKQIGYT